MKKLSCEDLPLLAIGASILGSGGGGNTSYDELIAKRQIELFGPAKLVQLEELDDDALIVPLAFMGAPLVGIEMIPSGREFIAILEGIEKHFKKRPSAIFPGEIGGSNAFCPFAVSSALDLPILDADMIGRAFPELQMSSCNLFGISLAPAFLADSFGNVKRVDGEDANTMEKKLRELTISMGSNAAIALYLMNGKEAKKALIPKSLTRAIALGRTILFAQKEKRDPILSLLKETNGSLLGSGTIIDIDQTIEEGFMIGITRIMTSKGLLSIEYQNENLFAFDEEKCLEATPTILSLLETETGMPITNESLRFGQRVSLIALEAPPIWKTKKGLELVGPEVFKRRKS